MPRLGGLGDITAEEVFLRHDVQGQLVRGLLNPLTWLSSSGRTEMAVELYESEVFRGATFDDMTRADTPLTLINASDLGYGVRFSFVQDYFNLLCSDISDYPVARAVTASSAVPVLFNPVVVAAALVLGGLAYVADRDSGLLLIDISDPMSPAIVSTTSPRLPSASTSITGSVDCRAVISS